MLYFFLRLCSQYLKVQCWSCSHSPIALQKKQFYKIRSLQLPISTDMQGLPRTVSTYHHRQSTDRSTSLCNDTNDPLDAIPKALLKMWSGFHLDTSNAKSTRICLVTNASDPSLHPFRKLQLELATTRLGELVQKRMSTPRYSSSGENSAISASTTERVMEHTEHAYRILGSLYRASRGKPYMLGVPWVIATAEEAAAMSANIDLDNLTVITAVDTVATVSTDAESVRFMQEAVEDLERMLEQSNV